MEAEISDYEHVIQPYLVKYSMTLGDFIRAYNAGEIDEPELDGCFLHDRASRESGHNISSRFDGICAHLATVDLNSLLYKYETDIARTIQRIFNDRFVIPPNVALGGRLSPGDVERSAVWNRRAKHRRTQMDRYLWSEEKGMYVDYDTVKRSQTDHKSATTFWAMWSGAATPRQAAVLM